MKWVVRILLLAVCLSVAAPALAVDEPGADSLELPIAGVDDSAHPEVTVTVTVPRELVGLDLRPSDFFVSENGAARTIDVTQLPSEELAVVIAIDTSGSMGGEPLLAAKRAVESFLDAMPNGVAVAVVGFGDTAQVIAPFTEDLGGVLSAVGPLQAGGETALHDAVILASSLFAGVDASRNALILLSDGGDTVRTRTLEDALIAVIDAGPGFLAVELESSENDPETLGRLASATEGRVVAATDPAALTAIFEETASDLVNQYELTFTSESEGPTELLVAVRRGDIAAVGRSSARFPDLPAADRVDTPSQEEIAPEPIFVPAPETVTLGVPWIATTAGLVVAAIAVFGALALTFFLMIPTRRGGLAFFGLVGKRPGGAGTLAGLAGRATMLAEGALSRSHGDRSVRLMLDQAGLRLRIGEFIVLLAALALVAFAVGFSFFGVLVGAFAAVAAVTLIVVVVRVVGDTRATKFRSQLPDTLQLLAGSLRAGFGLNTALAAVADEQEEPTGSEFNRMQVEIQLGRSIEDALRAAAIRVKSEDLPWVADAIEIHRETGGDVADLLDGIAATVRERERVRGQIKVLSAEGRVSGLVLTLMPFVLAVITYVAAPGYLAELTQNTTGRWMIAIAGFDMLIGIIWIRRIVRLKY